MPKIDTYQCDCGCGVTRQPSNHWRMVRLSKDGAWSICDWRVGLEKRPDVKFVAGQDCAHKLLDKFLSAPRVGKEEETI